MPLRISARNGREGLWITGTVTPAGAAQGTRVRRRAGSDDPQLAREEAVSLERQILRDAHHGERRGSRGWASAVMAYHQHEPRSAGTTELLIRLTKHFRDTPLRDIDQDAVEAAARRILRPGAKPSTRTRNVIAPVRAVLTFSAKRKWCDMPMLEGPKAPPSRVAFLLPAEFEALRAAIAPQHRPLLTWLIGTGCRRGETWALDWRDVDLTGARAVLHPDTTKQGKARVVTLLPAVVAMLASLPHRAGPVFSGADPRKALATAARDAKVKVRGLHDMRHSWASWHYAMHQDALLLQREGGWSSLDQVAVYAHLMPSGHESAIRRVWGLTPGRHRVLGAA